MVDINTGMSKSERSQAVDVLKQLLADTYILYLKTQNFHWNVTGLLFAPLHAMFEAQYQALAEAVDEIAERIRALGEFAPATLSSYLGLSNLDEADDVPSAEGMIAQLLDDHEHMARSIKQAFDVLDEAGDEVTLDLFIERMTFHEKTAWMLRASLD